MGAYGVPTRKQRPLDDLEQKDNNLGDYLYSWKR
jgi:hypothetical protein